MSKNKQCASCSYIAQDENRAVSYTHLDVYKRQGLSNLAGSFFSGYVSTGSFNRTGVNYESGAKTPMAAVFAGLLLILVVVLVAPYAEYLPQAAMAGAVSYNHLDVHKRQLISRTKKTPGKV